MNNTISVDFLKLNIEAPFATKWNFYILCI